MNPNRARDEGKLVLRYGAWIDAVPYFLLGTFTFGVGIVTAALWAIEQWSRGAYVLVSLGGGMMALLGAGFAFATRRRSRVLALACVLAWCGVVAYVLAGWGWRLPLIGV